MAFNSLFGILRDQRGPDMAKQETFNSLFGIRGRSLALMPPSCLKSFNSLFGIPIALALHKKKLELLSTPFSGFSWSTNSTPSSQGSLSTPFSGFQEVEKDIHRKRGIFQLPFRDSELRIWNGAIHTAPFNSLFGIPSIYTLFANTLLLLSTPFSGFKWTVVLTGGTYSVSFQLPFRDS